MLPPLCFHMQPLSCGALSCVGDYSDNARQRWSKLRGLCPGNSPGSRTVTTETKRRAWSLRSSHLQPAQAPPLLCL
ncbi:hypothetical protein AAFF_G00282660 [Aldrovandia affinis]|uniref:Uncharacterized protein n=1 Tax=Aldrovandia affinis TaxID=143900 RepID=A0AAD7T9V0_9TELE|nr:hypothetical protein AAFF_G00282660 [Aldrovandia affinis]